MEHQEFAAHTSSRDLLYGPSQALWDWALRPALWLAGLGMVPVLCVVAVVSSVFWPPDFTFQAFMAYYGLMAVTAMGLSRLIVWIKHWRLMEGWSLATNLAALGLCGAMLLIEGWMTFVPLLFAMIVLIVTDVVSSLRNVISPWVAGLSVPLLLYVGVAVTSFLFGLILQIPEG